MSNMNNVFFRINDTDISKKDIRKQYADIGLIMSNSFYKSQSTEYLVRNIECAKRWYMDNYHKYTGGKWDNIIAELSKHLCKNLLSKYSYFTKDSDGIWTIKEDDLYSWARLSIDDLYGSEWADDKSATSVIWSMYFNRLISFKKYKSGELKYAITDKQFVKMVNLSF